MKIEILENIAKAAVFIAIGFIIGLFGLAFYYGSKSLVTQSSQYYSTPMGQCQKLCKDNRRLSFVFNVKTGECFCKSNEEDNFL